MLVMTDRRTDFIDIVKCYQHDMKMAVIATPILRLAPLFRSSFQAKSFHNVRSQGENKSKLWYNTITTEQRPSIQGIKLET